MSEDRKASSSRHRPADRATLSSFSRPSWQKPSEPVPSGREIELYALRRELEFQKSELAAVKHVLRQKEYFVAELLDFLDAELSPGKVSSWVWYRRLIVRLK